MIIDDCGDDDFIFSFEKNMYIGKKSIKRTYGGLAFRDNADLFVCVRIFLFLNFRIPYTTLVVGSCENIY